jgi:hypothetical protein
MIVGTNIIIIVIIPMSRDHDRDVQDDNDGRHRDVV